MDEVMSQLVALAKIQFGEPEYAYFKKYAVYHSKRGRNDNAGHYLPIGDGDPVTQEEYEANIAECKRINLERFMGRWPRSYWDYHKKLTKPGWREKLLEMIGALPDSAGGSNG